jgi:hypothetical protein
VTSSKVTGYYLNKIGARPRCFIKQNKYLEEILPTFCHDRFLKIID